MAIFENGAIKPVVFTANGKNHKVKEIALSYQEREGSSVNYYFSVEAEDGNVFNLRYNDKGLMWYLVT